ncbi:copper amine oxidase N-terminal domain-containing protein [Paenibacillus methanolicus]|uniref:Copper amine oxidase-like protein n=1 Tax=Paenibacillus methanolicus TaxID=582686 RepID=A0A5S5BX30_9BACL|nr:copper amine oxidase N-terminal domain-containing protein [Paenibacillus methanolicus]TYP70193.1 copper amine oxidase-like protein [Paenibacillus methanolicus]
MKLFRKGLTAAVSLLLAVSPIQAWAAQPGAPAAQTKVYLNGEPLALDASPVTRGGTTLVPFRPIFEALGIPVTWDPQQRQITGRGGQTDIVLKLGSRTATVNGKQATLSAAPEAVNGVAYVPLRFVGEASQYTVAWNPASRAITLNRKAGETTGSSPTASTSTQSGQPDGPLSEQNAPGWIRGEVQGSTGNTWNIELWQVLPDGSQRKHSEAVTDTLGRFSFSGLTIGQTYIAQGEWPNSAGLRADRFVYQDDLPPILMQAMPNTAVIRFLLPDGEPVVSSDIEIVRQGGENSQPTYHIEGTSTYLLTSLQVGKSYTLSANLEGSLFGYTVIPFTFTYTAGQTNRYELQLKEAADSLTGKVLDDAGTPMRNVQADFYDQNDGTWSRTVYTNKDGRYAANGFQDGHAYRYFVRPPVPMAGELSRYAQNEVVTFTYSTSLKELPTQTIRRVQMTGTVKSQLGEPVQAFVILEDAAGKQIATSPATADGTFGLPALVEGQSYTLTPFHTGSLFTRDSSSWLVTSIATLEKKTFVYTSSMTSLDITVQLSPPLLGGKVQTAGGQVATGAKVHVEYVDGSSSRSFSSSSGSDGKFLIKTEGLKKGKAYAVSADGTMKSQTYSFTIEDNKVDLPILVLDTPVS